MRAATANAEMLTHPQGFAEVVAKDSLALRLGQAQLQKDSQGSPRVLFQVVGEVEPEDELISADLAMSSSMRSRGMYQNRL